MSKKLTVMLGAIFLPILVCGEFPPPAEMHPLRGLGFIAWLALVGGFAGYGVWRANQ